MSTPSQYAEHAKGFAEDRGISIGEAAARIAANTNEVTAAEIMEQIEGNDRGN